MKMISRDEVLRLLDEDGIVFRKTIERLPTYEIPDQHPDKNTSLTKDEVIKALECISGMLVCCDKCPYAGFEYSGICKAIAAEDAIALLKTEPRRMRKPENERAIKGEEKDDDEE